MVRINIPWRRYKKGEYLVQYHYYQLCSQVNMSATVTAPTVPNRYSSGYSDWTSLRPHVKEFVEKNVELCKPAAVHVCDGSSEENEMLLNKLVEQGRLTKLTKYNNW